MRVTKAETRGDLMTRVLVVKLATQVGRRSPAREATASTLEEHVCDSGRHKVRTRMW